jgi:hypothetical protein
MALKCDVTSWDDQVALFKAGYEKYGRIPAISFSPGSILYTIQVSVVHRMDLWLSRVLKEDLL